MRRHWQVIQWVAVALVFAVVASIVKGWLFITYSLMLGTVVVAFVYLIAIARFGGRPSDEDEEEATRKAKQNAKHVV